MSLSDIEDYFGSESIADCYSRQKEYDAEASYKNYVGSSAQEICELVKQFFPDNRFARSNLKGRTYSRFMLKQIEKDKGEVHLTIGCTNDPNYAKKMKCSHVSIKTVSCKQAYLIGARTELSVQIFLFGSDSLEFKYEKF